MHGRHDWVRKAGAASVAPDVAIVPSLLRFPIEAPRGARFLKATLPAKDTTTIRGQRREARR